jgi:hypothetical protein
MAYATRRFVLAIGIALIGVCGSVAPATAAEQVPFTIVEQVDMSEGGVDTFVATGSLCPSGTFVDEFDTVATAGRPSGRLNLMGYATFTCDDGSGTFIMRKHVLIAYGEDGSFTNRGPVQLVGGTGAYADIKGHGVDSGSGVFGESAVGVITGAVIED